MTRPRSRDAASCPSATSAAAVALALALLIGAPSAAAAQARAEPSGESSTLVFFNRTIVTLRATVVGRRPADRTGTAQQTLQTLLERGITGPVDVVRIESAVLVRVASRGVLAITPPDVDELSGETLDDVAAQTAERLRTALAEAAAAETLRAILLGLVSALLGLSLGALAVWGLVLSRRAVIDRIAAGSERVVGGAGTGAADVLRASRFIDLEQKIATGLFAGAGLLVIYVSMTFTLRQFPYTRPWGDSMRAAMLASAEDLALKAAHALPGLFTVALIFLVTRFLARLVRFWFNAIETGRIKARLIHPETAQPTRRLATTLLWIFGTVMAYPYLPGSQTEAFKGVSVFVGVLVTLGSSGLVNQIMSGFVITYSRALRVGNFVRIGDVEGTVTHLGVLSTKVRTIREEEVTVPNAVVIAQTTTDYSRTGDSTGVFTPTSVTIGYDTPWRQIHSLLLLAAGKTSGLRDAPKPFVMQEALQDFYVKYTLWVALERQDSRPYTMSALHANIQDLFNEYGVQIMSPNYMLDPAAPKIVAKKDWFAAPAAAGAPLGADIERT